MKNEKKKEKKAEKKENSSIGFIEEILLEIKETYLLGDREVR